MKKKSHFKLSTGIAILGFALFGMYALRMTQYDHLYYRVTCWILPLLTYEQQYGKQNVIYDNDYTVQSWYYNSQRQKEEKTEEEQTSEIGEEKEAPEKKIEEKTEAPDIQDVFLGDLSGGPNRQTFTREQLGNKEFLQNKIFAIDGNTHMTDEELSLENLLDRDITIKDLKEWDGSDNKKYKILIYHTHGSEAFRDSRANVKEDTIIGVGKHLAEILEKEYGIPVYHDTNTYDMIDGKNDRSGAYENAYKNVTETLKKNPTIEVAIDLHRDGVDEDVQLVTEVNGKKTAKIMFLNGVSRSNTNGEIDYLKNPNRLDNLAFSFQMYLKGKETYGDYIRKIYVKSLRFNLHLLPRTTLIEVGAQNNTLEEEMNAMEPLAAILNAVLDGENAN